MIAGDYNGDGKLDVAVMDSNGDVKVSSETVTEH